MSTRGALTDASGVVATGGTAQPVVPANDAIRYLLVINQSTHPLYIDFSQAATVNSIPLKACGSANDGTGGMFEWKASQGESGFVPTGAMSIYGGTTNAAFTVKWG